MLTHQEAQHLINEIQYLPGWKLMWIPLGYNETYSFMYWKFHDAEGLQECREWLIDLRKATPSDIVQTALRAAIDAQEHEVREQFRYKGKRIYGPHFNPESLVELARFKKNLSLKESEDGV